ncbi:helix-turn-helix transcriptional regulator [Clostridium baratii]|uniref:helix-turn-helix domain-containing protein n=1 Tax=Clostridium baratii TaxID=1561 RepID=UPI0030D128C1
MNNIKRIRTELGLSIYKIAELTSLTPSYINNLENGRKNNPTKDAMEKIASALGQTVPEIFYSKREEK